MDDVETSKLRGFLALQADAPADGALVRWQRRVELPLWRGVEARVRALADALVVCSDLDRTRIGGTRTHVVPNTYPVVPQDLSAPRQGATVLVVGTYHYPPNVDAAVHAARRVLPRLREVVPDAELRLVGRGGGELLTDVAGLPGVEVVGDVEDVAPHLRDARVVLVPVRYGGGTRIKVLEAFAHGVPVVTTSLGCEGLGVEAGVHALVADDADGLAAACARVLRDEALAARLSVAARRLHAEHFRPELATQAVAEVLRAVLPGPAPVQDARSAAPPAV
nr:glycosyltransferase [Kineococcus siccus]